ncbi:hypothetical protein BJY01DRAFT_219904 [Aspergillus pseudoustus]|uniref:GST N-terminal domain-containing protein n=1 Tax=Aspergillus pseudoustus TaxID=1810923 RepID=A0ABR4JGG2_9EURO
MAANRGARIILHSLERSRSQRLLWLLEELNMSYEIKPYKRGLHERAPPELKQFHPLGKAPILEIQSPAKTDGAAATGDAASGSSSSSIVLAESAVIMEHLLENFHHAPSSTSSSTQSQSQNEQKSLVPPRWIAGQENQVNGETEAWRRYRYYMHYTEGSLMPLVVTNILMDVVQNAPPFFLKPFLGIIPGIVKKEYCGPNFATHLAFLEEQLATPTPSAEGSEETSSSDKPRYLAGTQFTAADILMSYPLIILQEVKVLDKEQYPVLSDYVTRIRELEGYRKAVRILEEIEGQEYRVL